MSCGHVSGGLRREVVELDGRDSVVHAVDDALRDLGTQATGVKVGTCWTHAVPRAYLDRLDMVHVQAVTQLVDAGRAAKRSRQSSCL